MNKPNAALVALVYYDMFRTFLSERRWKDAEEIFEKYRHWHRVAQAEQLMVEVCKPLEVPRGR